MFRHLSIGKRIHLLVLLMGAALLAIGAAAWHGTGRIIETAVGEAQQIMLADQQDKLALLVGGVAETLGQAVKDEPSMEVKREIIRQAISTFRFEYDKSGYFYVYDFTGVCIAHSIRPEFVGTNRLETRDPEGRAYIADLLEKARDGGGFAVYSFDKPRANLAKKLAYGLPIPNTPYWIATGVYTDNITAEQERIRADIEGYSWQLALVSLGIAAAVLAVVVPMAVAVVRSVTRPLARTTRAARAIAAGDLTVTLDVGVNGEFRIMAKAFNDMTAHVRAAQERLEEQVRERTSELSQSLVELEAANERVMESIHYARTIQQAILPPSRTISQYLREYFVIWDPKDVIGGDLFWFDAAGDGFLIAVMDCTGHGVPGAIMTMLASTTLHHVVSDLGPGDPARILGELNRRVRQTLSQHRTEAVSNDGLDIGICFVEPGRGRITFAGAHLSLLVLGGEAPGEIREIKGDRESVGYKATRTDVEYTSHHIEMQPEMLLYMSTDGFSDQVGGDRGLPLGKSRLKAILEEVHGEPMHVQKQRVREFFARYKGDQEQRDDVTVFGFRLRAPGE
jgi:serine phosphatase RsbU (regulator of sigma subunit)